MTLQTSFRSRLTGPCDRPLADEFSDKKEKKRKVERKPQYRKAKAVSDPLSFSFAFDEKICFSWEEVGGTRVCRCALNLSADSNQGYNVFFRRPSFIWDSLLFPWDEERKGERMKKRRAAYYLF